MTRKQTSKAPRTRQRQLVTQAPATKPRSEWPEYHRIYDFLLGTLSAEDLMALPRLALPPDIAGKVTAALPTGSPTLAKLADDLLSALQQHYRTPPPGFWAHLLSYRPDRRPEIDALRRPVPRVNHRPRPDPPTPAALWTPGTEKIVTRLCLEARTDNTLNLLGGIGDAPSASSALARHFADLKEETINGAQRRLLISWTADELLVSAWPSLRAAGEDVPNPLRLPLPLTRPLQFQYFPRGVKWRPPPDFGQVVYGLRIVCWSGGIRRFDLFTSTHELCVEL